MVRPTPSLLARGWTLVRRAVDVLLARSTPLWVKAVLGAGLLYLASPYDIVPEWVPVIGVLDDLALAALLIAWANRFYVPDDNGA